MKVVNHGVIRFLGSVFGVVGVLFLIYFASACGIYNSADAPQYFTVRSLLEKRSVDISGYSGHPHYYVFPDIFYGKEGEVFGVRGYLTSAMTIPIYLVGKAISGFMVTDGFPTNAIASADFKTELAVTGLFGLFTALGIGYLVAVLGMVGVRRWTRWLLGLTVGLGTYAWKYANLVSRHGLEVLYLGMTVYLVVRMMKGDEKLSLWWLAGLWGTSFGIDLTLFTGLSVFICLWIARNLTKKHIFRILAMVFGILAAQVWLNFQWYGQATSSGTFRQPTVLRIVGEGEATRAWLSTPWIPAVRAVLVNWGKLAEESFSNFNNFPAELSSFASADFARRYNFYGIFSISPFLIFGLVSVLWWRRFTGVEKTLVYFSMITFFVGVVLNAKVLNFWGGNQYDVRYFYPFAVILVLPLGVALKRRPGKGWLMLKVMLVFLGLFSIYMGWLGQINMFQPALSGERKIWIEGPGDIVGRRFELGYWVHNTFYNLKNWWVGLGWYCIGTGTIWIGVGRKRAK